MNSQQRGARAESRYSASKYGAWLRLFVAAAFALLLSDIPASVCELYADERDCCNEPCEGADDQGHCPPDCSYGACAKTVSAPIQAALPVLAAAEQIRVFGFIESTRAPQGFHGDVFHPPRA